jgi:hypothetical protein
MKKYNFLWIVIAMLSGLIVNGQANKSIKADPVAQLKQLIEVPPVEMVSIKMVTIPMLSPESLTVGYDIKRTVEDAKMRCPLLQFDQTLELEGERNSMEEVGLEWKTTNAFSGLYFDVERSFKDTMSFEKVDLVWANDGAKEKYQLPDDNDNEAVSYYRVKLQLNDGNYKYSNTIAVKGFARNMFAVYPNPASADFWLKLSTQQAGNANFTLLNSQGEKVFQKTLTLSTGFNLEQIGIGNLPAGIYMIKVVLPDKQMRTIRITKI